MQIKTNVIASLLNTAYADVINPDETNVITLADNLSNVVDFGRQIVNGTEINSDWTTFGNMLDKVVKTVYMDTVFKGIAPPCYRDVMEFAGLKEFVHISVGEYKDNFTFNDIDTDASPNSFEELFGSAIPTVSCTYYGKQITYSQKYTKQFKEYQSAFVSPVAMMTFFTHLVNEISAKFDFAIDRLSLYAFDNAVLEKCASSDTTPVVVNTSDFDSIILGLKSAVRTVENFNSNSKGFVSATEKSHIKIAILDSIYDAITTEKANVHHPEYWNIATENVHVMPYFMSESEPSTIKGIVPSTDEDKRSVLTNVIAIVYDDRLFGVTAYDRVVNSQSVANRQGMTNFFDLATLEYIVNTNFACQIICATDGGYDEEDISSEENT